MLITANHKDKNWRGITVKRGQLVTGLHSLSKATGLSIQQIRTCFTRLKSTNEITIKSTNKYSVITLTNYSSYQDKPENQQAEQQAEQQTSNKQSTTNNNVNNKKENNKKKKTPELILDDWQPNDVNRQWLNDEGITEIDQQRIIRNFRDYWRLEKAKRANWDASFRKNPVVKDEIKRIQAKGSAEPWSYSI